MPSFFTHHFIGESVLQKLPLSTREKITDLNAFYLGLQGGDPLFLYSLNGGKNVGKILHKEKNYQLFLAFNNYFNEEDFDKKNWGFVLGYIVHYAIDTTFHPYIYELAEKIKRTLPPLRKKDNVHFLIERDIDVFLYEKDYGENLKDYVYPIKIDDNVIFSSMNFFNYALFKEFAFTINFDRYRKTVKNFFKWQNFLLDRSNNKRIFFYALEKVLFLPHVFSFAFVRPNPNYRFINYFNQPFNCGKESIYDLKDSSINKSLILIEKFRKSVEEKTPLEKEMFSYKFS